MGVGRLLHGAVPADVWLDDNSLAGLYEGLHAAELFDAGTHQRGGVFAPRLYDVAFALGGDGLENR